jgi:hypothetical protein
LRVAVGKNKICSKTKNHWLDLMVSSLHCTTTESSFNDFVKNGRAHKLNIKPKNLRMKGSRFLSLSCDDLSCSCSLTEPNDKSQKQQNLPSHATCPKTIPCGLCSHLAFTLDCPKIVQKMQQLHINARTVPTKK